MRLAPFIAVVLSTVAHAQDSGAPDARILALGIDTSGSMQMPTSPATMQVLLLPRGEHVVSATISDPSAFLVTVAGAADSIAIRAAGPRSLAMLEVRTDQRSYAIELISDGTATVPPVVRIAPNRPPSPPAPIGPRPDRASFSYRLSGSRTLLPATITDDGEKTYITWGRDQAMPATFAQGPTGAEQMVEGYVRDGVFTIDRVYGHLIFRIDREVASAERNSHGDRHD